MKAVKVIFKILLILLLIVALLVGGYVGYISLQYSRIADYTPVEVSNLQEVNISLNYEYSAITYNIGFGAYGPDYTFFMDEGIMADGTRTKGTSARAASEAAVITNTDGVIAALQNYAPDFILLQEVDQNATRSYHVNQLQRITAALPDYSYAYASNFHSAYLAYPFNEPIGSIESGLVSLSYYNVADTVRRSYPVDESFPQKFFDLDRCFTAQWLPIEGSDASLVMINSHMSAYDEGGKIRTEQLQMLIDMMVNEYEKGNYVIVGGDFNHALGVALDAFTSGQQIPDWVVELDLSAIPENFRLVSASNAGEVPTCRGVDIPYQKGVTYTTIVDGFIVSDNIDASAWNIDLEFTNSDHNPVQLTFTLLANSTEAEDTPAEDAAVQDTTAETSQAEPADELTSSTLEPLG